MGDLNKRRGRVLGMTQVQGGKQIIEADIPMTGVFGYCTVLRSMTGGRGTYEYEFAIGSKRTGEASMIPFLNACMVAVLNAISEESTG